MVPNGYLWIVTGFYGSLLVLMGPYVSSWIFISPYGPLLNLIGRYRSL